MKNGLHNQTAMRLHDAMICVDCETVYNGKGHTRCPACASLVSLPLTRIYLPQEGSLMSKPTEVSA